MLIYQLTVDHIHTTLHVFDNQEDCVSGCDKVIMTPLLVARSRNFKEDPRLSWGMDQKR
jgi:hypothetical protein